MKSKINRNYESEGGVYMCTNWKRFTLGAILLTTLSLFLFGCGGSIGGTPSKNIDDSKNISGIVSDSSTGLPMANATVTAYAINSVTGAVDYSAPLSVQVSVQSDSQGNFVLRIPRTYTGEVMIVATLPSSATGVSPIRAVMPSADQAQPVIVSLATEMAVQYVVTNNASSFTPVNVQTAVQALEPVFGQGFTQTPPPAIGTSPTPAQQTILVVTEAISTLVPTSPIASLVTVVSVSGNNVLALGSNSNLTTAVTNAATNLVNSGTLPGSYPVATIGGTISAAAGSTITVPDLTDTTAPSAPANLAYTATTSSVTLSWDAALASDGVTAYYIYRNGVFVASISAPAVSYADPTVLAASTSYMYEVKARDAAGNLSAGTTVTATTLAIPTYTISGVVTNASNGTPLSGVLVAITGAGSGVAVTDSTGSYSLTGARTGNYTLTPSLAGTAFTPVSRTITVSSNSTGNNFSAQQSGSVTGTGVYPNGVIIGGVTYPTGVVIGGVTYPTATIIGGVTYPTGTVIGGVTYPNGVVIGGVSYPAGTVVGGVAFPYGVVVGSVVYPTGTVNSGVDYSNGSVTGAVSYYVKIYGTVFDNTGLAGLSGVAVVVNNGTTQTTVTTNIAGTYSFIAVAGMSYTISPVAVLPVTAFSIVNSVNSTVTVPLIIDANIQGPDFKAQ